MYCTVFHKTMITQYVHPTSNITPTCTLHIRTYCTQVCTYVDIRQSTSNAHLKADRGNAEDEVTPIITFAKIYLIKVHEHSPTHVLTNCATNRGDKFNLCKTHLCISISRVVTDTHLVQIILLLCCIAQEIHPPLLFSIEHFFHNIIIIFLFWIQIIPFIVPVLAIAI